MKKKMLATFVLLTILVFAGFNAPVFMDDYTPREVSAGDHFESPNFLEYLWGADDAEPEDDLPLVNEDTGVAATPRKQVIYSGSNCVPVGNSAKPYVNEKGQAFNMGSSTITVLCPLEKDYSFGLSFTAVTWAIDQHYTENISCKALYENPGSPDGSSSFISTSGTNSTYQIIGTPLLTQPANSNWSHWSLLCKIPAVYSGRASGILTYRLDQY